MILFMLKNITVFSSMAVRNLCYMHQAGRHRQRAYVLIKLFSTKSSLFSCGSRKRECEYSTSVTKRLWHLNDTDGGLTLMKYHRTGWKSYRNYFIYDRFQVTAIMEFRRRSTGGRASTRGSRKTQLNGRRTGDSGFYYIHFKIIYKLKEMTGKI